MPTQFKDACSQPPVLLKIITLIKESVHPEKIFFTGITTTVKDTENIFSDSGVVNETVSAYHLVVLMPTGETINSIHEKIEASCRQYAYTIVFIQRISQFNEDLRAAESFALQTYTRGELVYDAGNIPFATAGPYNSEKAHSATEKLFIQGMNKAAEFLTGAELYKVRNQNTLAAFMLHQAIEQSCLILLRVMTGFNPNTHSLDKLFRYCNSCSYELDTLFPRHTDKEKQLFQLAQKAYIESRYSNNYTIHYNDLCILIDRIHQLHFIINNLCKQRLKENIPVI